MPMKLASCDPVEVITDEPIVPASAVPAIAEIEIEPNWFVKSIPSAHAAIGTANTSIAKITARLIASPWKHPPRKHPLEICCASPLKLAIVSKPQFTTRKMCICCSKGHLSTCTLVTVTCVT